jgi:shikimate dehydrogenase
MKASDSQVGALGPQNRIYCILGDERVYNSKSPAMFSAVIRQHGIKGTYVPFKVAADNLGHAMQSLPVLNIAGANVTVPYKERVVPFLDVLSEGAQIIGAINTIVRTEEGLKGYNTNAIGFMDALTSVDYDVEEKSALVLGTGGAARAAAFILNWLRTKTLYVAGRSEKRTQELAERFSAVPLDLATLPDHPLPVDIVVNATAVSGADESQELTALVSRFDLPQCEFVLDLNYDRPKNIWEDLARTLGAQFMDGLPPLAYQARRTFALWTGLQVPPKDFLSALGESIG